MAARRLRTVFFGSSKFSVPALERMLEQHDVVAVCSQPDKPAGRGLALTATPVSMLARDAGCELLTPQRIDAAFVERIVQLRPQLLATASYGKILPPQLLEIPGMTALNVHPSLLPLYRGATPIQSVLRDGREQTGVTIFWMTQRMDAGDIALAAAMRIEPADDFGSLHERLANQGADLLAEAAAQLSEGRLPRTPQREEDATYCKPLTKDDLKIRFDAPARRVVDQVRSLSPKPGAWMMFDGKRLKVLKAEVVQPEVVQRFVDRATSVARRVSAPETLIACEAEGPIVAASPGAIRLLRVIPEGKPAMSGADFVKAFTRR